MISKSVTEKYFHHCHYQMTQYSPHRSLVDRNFSFHLANELDGQFSY